MLIKKTNPSFICFTTDMKQEEGEGHVVVIARIEDMELENETIMSIREIQKEAAEKIHRLLDT